MEVKRMFHRDRVLASAALAFCLAGCAGRVSNQAQTPYIQASVCSGCHAKIAKSYRQTGMGRSFYRPSAANGVEDYAKRNQLYHRPSGRHYTMIERDGQWFQRRHQAGFDGKETNALEMRVDYVIGSGNHARNYLHRTADGRLIEMPVSWYSESGGYWAMSPGYDRPNQQDFRRAIAFSCMFCHNAYPDPAPDEDGVFPAALPEGIDCQRCHGPGRAHAEAAGRKASPETIRRAIVNPAHLSRERQLDVCMQCHLEPTSRPLPNVISRFEHGPFDYRPGEPLTDYFLFFDRSPAAAKDDNFEIAHAAYRLRKSKCFQASQMTCTTCHNPHDVPRGEQAAARYNATCRNCHAAAHTAGVPGGGDCASCHMPHRRTEDAVHVVMTDHYIRRRIPARDLLAARAETADAGYRGEVVPYYPDKNAGELYVAVAQVRDAANLDGGIPRLRQAIERLKPSQPEFYLELAKAYSKAGNSAEAARWCEEALRIRPGFRPALKELGAALVATGEFARAAEMLRQVSGPVARTNLGNVYLRLGRVDVAEQMLRANPEDPDANNLLGMVASARGDHRAAEQFFRKALELQTDHAEAHHNLANLLAAGRDYPQAAYHFQQAITANPAYAEAHYRFGLLLLATGAIDRAQREIEETVRLKPGLAEAHRDLADILAAKGRAREAAAEYRLAEALAGRQGASGAAACSYGEPTSSNCVNGEKRGRK
jgi:predicted CXXCH cytochrome family protein